MKIIGKVFSGSCGGIFWLPGHIPQFSCGVWLFKVNEITATSRQSDLYLLLYVYLYSLSMIKTLMRYLNHYENINLISISKINYFILIQISTQNPAKNVIESQPCLEAVFCERRIIMSS